LLTYSYVNLCWVIGQFIASGVLVGVQPRSDEWGWRIPYAIQWVWPLPIIAVCLLCPESPTWRESGVTGNHYKTNKLVVEHGQEAKAEHAVSRLQTSNPSVDIPTPSQTVALLAKTNAMEKAITADAGYAECFKGTNLRRTEITVGVWVTQQMCGPVLQVST
jgi:SP family general alpha glucoside:H+ symporter-like MFS transporter